MSSNEESGAEEEDSGSHSPKHGPPGFSFSKSAIADLPSTAVQSIYIENEVPVEMDDDVFIWRDTTPSGLKLAAKTKFKKQDWMKGKQAPPQGQQPPAKGAAVKANPGAAAVHSQAQGVKQAPASVAPSSAPSAVKEVRVPSKNRLVGKERPSQRKEGAPSAAGAVPKKVPSGSKVALAGPAARKADSQTKLVAKQNSREKNNPRREPQKQPNQGKHK